MKFALLFEFSTLNGGERSMLAVLDSLKRQSSTVEFIAICPPVGRLPEALRQRQVVVVPWSPFNESGQRLPADLIEETLLAAIGDVRADLVHSNSLAMGRLTGRLSARIDPPVMTHVRDIVKLSAAAIAELNRNECLIAVSQATRDYHVAQGIRADRTTVIYNGVNLDEFYPHPSSGQLRQQLEFLPRTPTTTNSIRQPVIMTIGQIGLRKGHNVLAQAAPRIVGQFPHAQFVVVGERNSNKQESIDFERSLKSQFEAHGLAGHLHLLGYRTDVARLLNEADVLVHPANQEPLGRVLLEACACGVPIVATDVGGTREIIEDGISGLLTAPNQPEAISTAIARILSDRSFADGLGQQARLRAERMFSIESAAQHLESTWRDVLNRHRS